MFEFSQQFHSSKKSKVTLGIALIVTVLMILVGWYFLKTNRYEFGFDRVKIGETKESVLKLMGKESESRKCDLLIREKISDVNCSEIYGFYSIFTYWAVAFDEKGNVVKKYRWTFDDGYQGASDLH